MTLRSVLAGLLWPALVAGTAWLSYRGSTSGWPLPLALFTVNVALIGTLLVLERLFPERAAWNAAADPETLHDVAHSLSHNPLADLIGGSVVVALADAIGRGLGTHVLWPAGWPLPAQAVLVIALGDGLDYWRHRLMHTVPGLWRYHALHHSMTRLHALKAPRIHVTELLVRYVVVYAPLALAGAPPAVVFWWVSAISIFGPVAHSNLHLRLPRLAHRLVLTPQLHRLHHSIEPAARGNYTNVLPVWDLLFGTFVDPDRVSSTAVGVPDDPMPPTFLGQVAAPFAGAPVPSSP